MSTTTMFTKTNKQKQIQKNFYCTCILFHLIWTQKLYSELHAFCRRGNVTKQNLFHAWHELIVFEMKHRVSIHWEWLQKKHVIHVCIAWSVECVAWFSVWVMAWSSRVINRKFHQITLIRNITLNHTLTQFRILFDSCIDCTIHCAQ